MTASWSRGRSSTSPGSSGREASRACSGWRSCRAPRTDGSSSTTRIRTRDRSWPRTTRIRPIATSPRRRPRRYGCGWPTASRITTAGRWCSVPTGTSTSAPATVVAGVIPSARGDISTRCLRRSCASTSLGPRQLAIPPTGSRRTTRSSRMPMQDPRSSIPGSAIRGGSASIVGPATCGSPTSGRATARRSTSRARASVGSTSGGTSWRARRATRRGRTTAPTLT